MEVNSSSQLCQLPILMASTSFSVKFSAVNRSCARSRTWPPNLVINHPRRSSSPTVVSFLAMKPTLLMPRYPILRATFMKVHHLSTHLFSAVSRTSQHNFNVSLIFCYLVFIKYKAFPDMRSSPVSCFFFNLGRLFCCVIHLIFWSIG